MSESRVVNYPIDSATFRRVLGHYPTGVCVVTARDPGGDTFGMVVGSFTSVSLQPPLVGFFPDRSSKTWPLIERTGRFCVNVLAAGQHDLCRRFSMKGVDKFAGISHSLSTAGSPILEGVVAWIDCRIHAVHEAGDHYIVLGEVVELHAAAPGEPMLFFRGGYREFASLGEAVADSNVRALERG